MVFLWESPGMPLDTTKSELQQIGNFDLVEKIAEGGMGTVYRGRHRETGEIVAVKLVPPHMANNSVFLKRFEQEYNAAKALDHPNVVKALEFGRSGKTPYLVMEFVEGESLGQKLERDHSLSESESIQVIGQVAQGLHRAHKLGLIHRDVKPDNILITPDGQVKLVDLGLVKEIDADLNLTRTNRGLGTPHFMAPEQFRNAKNADARCDIYSMAATMYMMVTGELPFKSCGPLDAWMKKINNELTPPRQLAPELSERVDWAIRRSMSADPTQRAATCREFIEDLTGHSTRRITATNTDNEEEPADLWYMIYKDEDDVVHTVKGTMNGIRRSLKEGLLGDAGNVRVSRSKAGPFESLKNHPEFRDLVFDVTPQQAKTGQMAAPEEIQALRQEIQPILKAPSVSMSTPLPPAAGPTPHATVDFLPTIHLGRIGGQPDWAKWLTLLAMAIFTGVAGYFLKPILAYLRLL
jgi:serine/threonine protein kinase